MLVRLLIAAVFLYPAVLDGQDTVRQRLPTFEQWRQQQVATAEASEVDRKQRRERDDKALAELARRVERLQLVRRDWGYAVEASRYVDQARAFQGYERWGRDFEQWRDNLAIDHEQRRYRLSENDSSAMQLDAVLRVGELDQVITALERRSRIVKELQFVAGSLAQDAEDRETWADHWWHQFMAENRPEAPAELKLRLRVGIEHYRRVASYARAIIEFESGQHDVLSAEHESLLQQIAAASALRKRP